MFCLWRRGKATTPTLKNLELEKQSGTEFTIPDYFLCPISLDLMKDPVVMPTGITYHRPNIEKWIYAGNQTCPVTNQVLTSLEPIPNHTLRQLIQDWCVENRSHGIEPIPTPKIPVSSFEITGILSKIGRLTQQMDSKACRVLVAKIKDFCQESERNKQCIVANGTGKVLSSAFEAFSKGFLTVNVTRETVFDKNIEVLGEILSALTMMTPLDEEANFHLGAASSLRCMVWFSRCGELSGRRNAVWTLKGIISWDNQKIEDFEEIEGALEALFKMIKESICPSTTKGSLMVIYHIVSSSSLAKDKVIARFIEMGLVEMLIEKLVDPERGLCERALGVLDVICVLDEGRLKAYAHSLTMPVLVKKILRVSVLVSEFSVSIILNLCQNEKREGGVLAEALQAGAFQKLMVLIQMGCTRETKEKVNELFKLLNPHRESLECIDSMDFKDVKRDI